ncbi:MAG: MFS transporter [Bacteroidia bacterium]|nr:MFS transporter [Bacteroidia bacterium]
MPVLDKSNSVSGPSGTGGLMILISVFFFWGFVAASNTILIPVFREHFELSQWEAMFVDVAFYIAYTAGSLIYMVLSLVRKRDLINEIGYRNGIALGLFISALGTLLFYPAAQSSSFPLMLTGLFVVGLGFSLQQTAANPLAINLGDPKKGAQRLSLAGGINNIGTTIGPVLVSFAIFGALDPGAKLESLESVKGPYLILGAAFILVALFFKFSSLPDYPPAEAETGEQKQEGHVIRNPQVWMGMIAIFVYVGVEVATAANLPEFMKQKLGVPTEGVAPYVSLFWASLMIGRWTGAVGAMELKPVIKLILRFILPYAAFGIFLLVNFIGGADLTPFYYYFAVIPLVIFAEVLSKGSPARQLMIFSFLGISALLVGMLGSGMVSVYAFISVGLFCSTLWPCIFTLAIAGLGKKTNDASSFLIMMIMGGGWISLAQGSLADTNVGIQWSYFVGVGCFVYLLFYGFSARTILKQKGIDYESGTGSGH